MQRHDVTFLQLGNAQRFSQGRSSGGSVEIIAGPGSDIHISPGGAEDAGPDDVSGASAALTSSGRLQHNGNTLRTVLEVGTGSGYQAAVLAEIAAEVYSIEIVEPLAQRAARDLAAAGYDRVEVRAGDGYAGWPEHAPFDAILVTAAPDHVPEPLQAQLAVGGRMVLPVGPDGGIQELIVLEKQPDGRIAPW